MGVGLESKDPNPVPQKKESLEQILEKQNDIGNGTQYSPKINEHERAGDCDSDDSDDLQDHDLFKKIYMQED